MTAKAVEALDADERPEGPLLFEQPKQAERVADGNRILRPVARAWRPSGDEAEIDETHAASRQMTHDFVPHSRMEAPAMDKHEMHGCGFLAQRLSARAA